MTTDFGVEAILERQGCPLHYWLLGPRDDLPLVVFMHGAGIDHRVWAPQAAAFSAGYRVLTMDLRGHGLSRPAGDYAFAQLVDDVFALLDAVRAERVILIGLSMGGNVAQEMVFRRPDRFAALVCADCTCNTLTPWWDRATLPIYQALIGPALRAYPRQSLLETIAKRTSLTAEGRRYVFEATDQLTNPEIAQVMKALLAALHHEPGYRVMIPELLVHGSDDKLGNIGQVMPVWRARDPQSDLAVIPNAGHTSNLDNPEAFNRQVLDWLSRL
jgi:pimeloyl-ACP methyl ester carboxylesterase